MIALKRQKAPIQSLTTSYSTKFKFKKEEKQFPIVSINANQNYIKYIKPKCIKWKFSLRHKLIIIETEKCFLAKKAQN
jgi:hypothetical protein